MTRIIEEETSIKICQHIIVCATQSNTDPQLKLLKESISQAFISLCYWKADWFESKRCIGRVSLWLIG